MPVWRSVEICISFADSRFACQTAHCGLFRWKHIFENRGSHTIKGDKNAGKTGYWNAVRENSNEDGLDLEWEHIIVFL